MESEQDESRRIKSQFKYGGFSGYHQELAMGTANTNWICPYISRHLLSLNPLQARCRRYSRGER
ncbi:hypothetical protein ACN73_27435 [Escherichia coli]|nr:hypothetical protein ACN73_27435 [Escherichia coli]